MRTTGWLRLCECERGSGGDGDRNVSRIRREDQICPWHRDGCAKYPHENLGWWKVAQDRQYWCSAEQSLWDCLFAFDTSYGVKDATHNKKHDNRLVGEVQFTEREDSEARRTEGRKAVELETWRKNRVVWVIREEVFGINRLRWDEKVADHWDVMVEWNVVWVLRVSFVRCTLLSPFHVGLPCVVCHLVHVCVERSAPKLALSNVALDPGVTQPLSPTQPVPQRQRHERTPVQDTSEPLNTMDKNQNEDLEDPDPTQSMQRVVTSLEQEQVDFPNMGLKRKLGPACLQLSEETGARRVQVARNT